MKHLILYLLSAALMSAGGNVSEKKETLLEPITMHIAIQIDCEYYRVFYTEGEKLHSKKGKLIDFVRMGMDVNDIILMSENTWNPRKYGRGFKTNYKVDLRDNFALVKDSEGNIYEVRYNELEMFFMEDNI